MSPLLSRRLKRRLEELESTAESHLPMAPKRARTDNQITQLGPIKFDKEILHRLFVELNRARNYVAPYGDLNLQWEDDALWETIMSILKLPVLLSVHEFKLNLMGYYEAFESNTLLRFTDCEETLTLIRALFVSRRDGLVNHLASLFCPPPNLALEQYRQKTVIVVSNNSGMLQPLRSFPSSSSGINIYTDFAQSLKEIKDELSLPEFSWVQLHMTKNKGLMTLFCGYDRDDRIKLVQDGYGDFGMASVPGSPL
ncbi:hypothetical protein OROGR_028117 [Orobanche gracilis]